MDDPLEMEAPESVIQRVHSLAYDLAYGVVKNFWTSELNSGWSFSEAEDTGTGKLRKKWKGKWPSTNLLLAFGYLHLISHERNDTKWYVLTPKAFDLLENAGPKSVFISYRRSESSLFALLLVSRLKAVGLDPFLDMQDIKPGDKWEERLKQEVYSRQYFICLISPTTLQSLYVREEIAWAVEAGLTLIPIWHNEYNETLWKEDEKQYPELSEFVKINSIQVRHEDVEGYNNAVIKLLNRFGVTPA